MAESDNKKQPIRRRMTPITQYAPADAVNEALRVSGAAPEQLAQRQAIVEGKRQVAEEQLRQQKARRDQYRARRQAQDKANGVILSLPMTDAQVDLAMTLEAQASNQPQLTQGYTDSEKQARRRAGVLHTSEDMEQAKKLAEAHNASFFGSMVAPPISSKMAEENPEYVRQVVKNDATVLPNAFISGLSFGAPSATAAIASGARQGWQTAGNVATKAWNAASQGVKSVAPVAINPRWVTTTAAATAPAIAEAANGDRSVAGVSAELALLSGLGIGAYKLGKRGYTGIKSKMFPDKGTPPAVVVKPTTMVEKAPKKVEYPSTRVYTKPTQLPAGATDAEKQAYNEASTNYEKTKKFQDYTSQLRAYKQTRDYNNYVKAKEAYDKLPETAKKWRARALWSVPVGLGALSIGAGSSEAVGNLYKDIFPNSLFRSLWSNSDNAVPAQAPQQSTENPDSTIIVVPTSPYVEGVNTDSLTRAAYNLH